jgi:hypothetical protein
MELFELMPLILIITSRKKLKKLWQNATGFYEQYSDQKPRNNRAWSVKLGKEMLSLVSKR